MWIEIRIVEINRVDVAVVIPRIGGCGLKFIFLSPLVKYPDVIPRIGGCGLKYFINAFTTKMIVIPRIGGCGLKFCLMLLYMAYLLVIPRIGGCGLKFPPRSCFLYEVSHPPHRGMWIEIKHNESLRA